MDETLVVYGGAVKALGDGRVGGYLVTFGTPDQPDLEGDYFAADTDFGDATTSPVYYQHGLDDVLKKRRIGRADIRPDDVGVWVEAQLELRDEYEKAVYALAEKGKLGWSSGTAGHLVEREAQGKAYHIKSWPLGLDASLTPTPAEPRNSAIPLKSLLPHEPPQEPVGTAQVAGDATPGEGEQGGDAPTQPQIKTVEKIKMELTEERLAELLDDAATKAVNGVVAKLPPTNGGGHVEVTKDAGDQPFESLGAQLKAVQAFAVGRKPDPRLASKQTGMEEGVPSEGGFLVQQDFVAELLKPAYDASVLASRVRRFPISGNSNGLRINAVAETSRATGSRWGGVQTYWLGEGGTKTASRPLFRQIQLDLKKLIGLCYATDELLQDAAALQSVISQAFTEEFAWMLDEAIYNGTGVGQPLGFQNSPALVTQAAEAGQAIDTVVSENIIKMYSRMPARNRANAIWLYNQDIEPQLMTMGLTVGLGGIATYMPPGGLSDAPYARILGKPAFAIEQADNLGDVGDISFVDLSQYLMIDKGGIQSASSIHVQFVTDETAFRFVYRVDGQPAWVAPMTPANGTTTLSPFVTLAAR